MSVSALKLSKKKINKSGNVKDKVTKNTDEENQGGLDTTTASFHDREEEGEVKQEKVEEEEKEGRRWCF